MSTHLGSTSDGRALAYDASLYEFWLDGERAAFADVQMLDTRNWIRWRAPALRDWFRHIIPADLDACNKRARAASRAAAGVETEKPAAAQAPTYQATVSCQEDDGYLLYRTTDDAVASVNDQGIVKVHGSGRAEIYARRIRNGVSGPEMRVATVVLEDGLNGVANSGGPEAVDLEEPAKLESSPQTASDDGRLGQKHKHKKGKHKAKTVVEEVQPEVPQAETLAEEVQPEAPQAEIPQRSWLRDDSAALPEPDFTKGVGGFATWNVR